MDFGFGAVSSQIVPGTFTVDTLPTPSATYVDLYARVTDLFGEKRDLVLCSLVGSTYFWQPVRQIYAKSLVATNMSLVPLKTPSILRMTGTLAASKTISLDTTNAWPGTQFEVAFDGLLGIFSLTITGLDLGATLSMLAGSRKRVFFDGVAYQSY